ncbi:hypothetical protein HY988_00745 [Candidatus Micrarchaeota archaeon]|nr:hypothetical protein [Candidatus Micrarchaeota archaeon]
MKKEERVVRVQIRPTDSEQKPALGKRRAPMNSSVTITATEVIERLKATASGWDHIVANMIGLIRLEKEEVKLFVKEGEKTKIYSLDDDDQMFGILQALSLGSSLPKSLPKFAIAVVEETTNIYFVLVSINERRKIIVKALLSSYMDRNESEWREVFVAIRAAEQEYLMPGNRGNLVIST